MNATERSAKIQNLEPIEVKGDETTKTIFVRFAGFTKNDRFCFYIYDENMKNGSIIYLSTFNVRSLINSGKLN